MRSLLMLGALVPAALGLDPMAEKQRLHREANSHVSVDHRLSQAPHAPVAGGATFTGSKSQTDYSVGGRRSRENAETEETDKYADRMRAEPVQELFTNGVDMSAVMAAKRAAEFKLRGNNNDIGNVGKVDDGLGLNAAFGEDAESLGTHSSPDEPAPVNEWNPVPPGFQQLEMPGTGLEGSLAASALTAPRKGVELVDKASDEHDDPDGLSKGPNADVADKRKSKLVYRPKFRPMPGASRAAPITGAGTPHNTPGEDSTV